MLNLFIIAVWIKDDIKLAKHCILKLFLNVKRMRFIASRRFLSQILV